MGGGTWNRRSPWLLAFVMAVVSFAGSLAALAVSVARSHDSPAPAANAELPAAGRQGPLTFTGELPATLAGLPLRAAAPGEQPDVAFETGAADRGVPVRYFVPVAALGAGVDSLTLDQLKQLLAGSIGSVSQIGGTEAKPRVAVAGPEADQAFQRASGVAPGETFATYAELRAAMTVASGVVALVPLDEVRAPMVALAVDGVDIVRGRGDPARWPFVQYLAATGLTARGRAEAPALQERLRATVPKATTVVATGDILQSRCSLAKIQATGDWGAALRGPVAAYLASADLALGSLDGSIQDIGKPWGCVEITNLTSPPEVIEALTLAGFDELTVATNHTLDCGQTYCGARALLRTIELLHQAGIKTVGGGASLDEALAPAIFEVNGTRFGVLGFDDVAAQDFEATATEPGTAPLDDDYAEERKAGEPAFFRPASELSLTRFTGSIRTLKQQVDVVIVQVQSGTEDTHDPSPRSLKALRAAADAGADLVVGNQAHWVQAVEPRGDTFIAYALGNFIFDQVHTPEHTQGYLLEATFHDKQLVTIRLVPYQIADRYRPVFAEGPLRAKILGDVAAASPKLPPP